MYVLFGTQLLNRHIVRSKITPDNGAGISNFHGSTIIGFLLMGLVFVGFFFFFFINQSHARAVTLYLSLIYALNFLYVW